MFTIDNFKVGDRVEIHPALDRWMQGDRCGEVVKITPHQIHVKMDVSQQTITGEPAIIVHKHLGKAIPIRGKVQS